MQSFYYVSLCKFESKLYMSLEILWTSYALYDTVENEY